MKKLIPLILALTLAGCAGPVTLPPQGSSAEIQAETQREKELAYKKTVEDQDRVYNVAFPLLAANADFCGDQTVPAFGMTAWNIDSVSAGSRVAAANLYNLQPRLAVQYVADASPAAKAGIRSGDFIVAINGQGIPDGKAALKEADAQLKTSGYRGADMLLERNGGLIRAVVQPVRACRYPVILDPNSAEINAFADGRRIVITRGILRFTENDNELALIIAHELGHNAMRHIDKRKGNALAGGLGGLAIDSLLAAAGVSSGGQFSQLGQQLGASSYSVAFEQEADYVGMYFMERAGYRSAGVADFWRRFATEVPASVAMRGDHPTSPERFLAIERAHREIAKKKAASQALEPNLQEK